MQPRRAPPQSCSTTALSTISSSATTRTASSRSTPSEQFLLLVAGKGGATDPLPFTSGVIRLDHLLDLESRTLPIRRATFNALAPETLAVPDTRDPALLDLLGVIYRDRPLLLEPMPRWRAGRSTGDANSTSTMTGHTSAVDAAGAPLREGKHIHQFVHDFAAPTYRLIQPDGEHALLRRAMKRARTQGRPLQPAAGGAGSSAARGQSASRRPGVPVRPVPAGVPGDSQRDR